MTSTARAPRTDWNPTRNAGDCAHPERFYTWSQAEAPVVWSGDIGAWLVSDHQLVRAAAADTATFSSAVAVPTFEQALPADVLAIAAEEGLPGRNMVQADPPEHRRLRMLGHRVLTAPLIERAAPAMRRHAHTLLDAVADQRQCELVGDLANPYVQRVLNELIGVDGVDGVDDAQIEQWNNAFLGLVVPTTDHATKRALAHDFVDYTHYLNGLLRRRRAEPRDDMTSALVAAYTDDGIDFDDALPEMRMFLLGLWGGGIHTTEAAITSAAWTWLATDGGQPWRELAANPTGLADAVEETLRLHAPHRGLLRQATRDTTLGDIPIAAGELVMLLFGAACQDPAVFDTPDAYTPGRGNIRAAMPFGHGIHHCLARVLARREIVEALTVLTQRLPHAHLAENYQPDWAPEFFFRQLTHLDLVW